MAFLAAAVAGAPGCAGSDGEARAAGAAQIGTPVVTIPSQLLGLRVELADISELVGDLENAHVDSVALFTMREGDLLRATLQVSRFEPGSPAGPGFRRQVVEQLGTRTPIELNVAGTNVFSTGGTQQSVYVWFDNGKMIILSIQQDFEFPRLLLRRALEGMRI